MRPARDGDQAAARGVAPVGRGRPGHLRRGWSASRGPGLRMGSQLSRIAGELRQRHGTRFCQNFKKFCSDFSEILSILRTVNFADSSGIFLVCCIVAGLLILSGSCRTRAWQARFEIQRLKCMTSVIFRIKRSAPPSSSFLNVN